MHGGGRGPWVLNPQHWLDNIENTSGGRFTETLLEAARWRNFQPHVFPNLALVLVILLLLLLHLLPLLPFPALSSHRSPTLGASSAPRAARPGRRGRQQPASASSRRAGAAVGGGGRRRSAANGGRRTFRTKKSRTSSKHFKTTRTLQNQRTPNKTRRPFSKPKDFQQPEKAGGGGGGPRQAAGSGQQSGVGVRRRENFAEQIQSPAEKKKPG